MKAADGVQIAERWAAEYDEMKTCALRDTAEHYKNRCLKLIEELSRAEERERVLRKALERPSAHTHCCFCGTYNPDDPKGYAGERACHACGYGGVGEGSLPHMASNAWKNRDAAPEQPAPKPWGFSGYLEVLPDKPSFKEGSEIVNKDEEYVRSVWAVSPVKQEFDEDGPMNLWSIHEWVSSTPLFAYESQDEAWSAAAEFTRERQEQVRQLREEIALVESLSRHSGSPIAHACSGETISHLHLDVKRFARWSRILARLEAELTRLTAGMKPEAL